LKTMKEGLLGKNQSGTTKKEAMKQKMQVKCEKEGESEIKRSKKGENRKKRLQFLKN